MREDTPGYSHPLAAAAELSRFVSAIQPWAAFRRGEAGGREHEHRAQTVPVARAVRTPNSRESDAQRRPRRRQDHDA